jgi:hypothetical protein
MSAIVSRGPDAGHAYPITGALGWGGWMPRSLPGRGWRANGWTGYDILSVYT